MLEVCVDNIASAIAAVDGGAKRLELCSSLDEGGLTPTIGLLLTVKKYIDPAIPVFGMIRCRRGNDFVYIGEEMEVMMKDAQTLIENGIDGLVFGALTEDQQINQGHCRQIIAIAGNLPCTFHRAFDMTKEEQMMENCSIIANLGFNRILTSGFKRSALEGIAAITKMIKDQKDILIMPGAGVTEITIDPIVRESRCTEFHASARSAIRPHQRDANISMGRISDIEPLYICDSEKVQAIIQNAKQDWPENHH